jgi:hypothetical protein
VAAIAGLLVASGTSAAATSGKVPLTVKVVGSGTVRAVGQSFTCSAKSCRHTFLVPRLRRTVVTASPKRGWKLATWAPPCKRASKACSVRLKTRRSLAVTFVPPGNRLNPYPLRKRVTVADVEGGSWRLKVNSAIINADSEVEAVIDPNTGKPANAPPPPGAHYTLVNLSLTHVEGGSSLVGDFFFDQGQIATEGSHDIAYNPDSCVPPPVDLGAVGTIFPGQTETGNLCFAIASNDSITLKLRGIASAGDALQTVWFALR